MPDLVNINENQRRNYRVKCALYCVLAERYRVRKYIHGMAQRLIGLDAQTERSSERWMTWGGKLKDAPWAEYPWKEIAFAVSTKELALETILQGTGISVNEVLKIADNPTAYEAASTELTRILSCAPQTLGEWKRWLEVGLAPATDGEVILMPIAPLSDGNTVPLRWTWELWCYANGRTDDGEWREMSDEQMSKVNDRALLHGSRGGMKTMGLAAVVFSLCWFVAKYSAVHCAATVDQAGTVTGYIKRWVQHAHFKHKVKKDNLRNVEFDNGSALSIITASTEGLNHEHTLWFSCDEVELMAWKVLLQGLRIPMRRPGRHHPAVTVLASTQKEPGLTMTILIEKALNGEYRYFRWNVFDVIERCDPWRTQGLPEGIQCKDWATWAEKAEDHTSGMVSEALRDRALYYMDALKTNCPLVEYCQGKAKQGGGHYQIKETINALSDSMEQFEAEMMCLRPSPQGAVYPKFDYRNITDEAVWQENCRIVASADYGYATDPAAANFMCLNGPHYDVFAEFSAYGLQAADQAEEYVKFDKQYHVEFWCVDGSARELITEMKKRGMRVVPVKSHNISRGIGILSSWICNARQHRALRIHPCCKMTIRQMQGYMLSDRTSRPKTHQDDHHPDGLRYMAETIGTNRSASRVVRKATPIGSSPGLSYSRGSRDGI